MPSSLPVCVYPRGRFFSQTFTVSPYISVPVPNPSSPPIRVSPPGFAVVGKEVSEFLPARVPRDGGLGLGIPLGGGLRHRVPTGGKVPIFPVRKEGRSRVRVYDWWRVHICHGSRGSVSRPFRAGDEGPRGVGVVSSGHPTAARRGGSGTFPRTPTPDPLT